VRIRVRLGPSYPLVCRKRRLNGTVLRMRTFCDQSAEDAYSMALAPTFAFIRGPCCPTLGFVFCFLDYDYVLHIVNFGIRYDYFLSLCDTH
jgi:hypothetical protein